jgi:hypothetical protein
MWLGHPALRRLAALKLRAWLRSTRRRLGTPSGFLFGVVGFGIMALWIGSLFVRTSWMQQHEASSTDPLDPTKAGIALMMLLAAISALSHRGLYMPKEEIERLLSAPVSRADLVRYRLWVTLGKSLVFSLIMAWFFSRRMPEPWYGFAGAFVTLMTLPLVGQAVALVSGDTENRLARWSKRLPLAGLRVAVGLAFWCFLMLFLFAGELREKFPNLLDFEDGASMLVSNPVFAVLFAPLTPWARAMVAQDLRSFGVAFLSIVAIWAVLFELVARMPVDFRELSLETSADVARRINRLRSGRMMGTQARRVKGRIGWNVPWLFGHGPFGAIAWLQLCGIARKARGTLLFSALITAVITFMTAATGGVSKDDPTASAAFVAGMATIYLGWGLRFDFRSNLDTMSTIKSWPLPAWQVFTAMLVPEVGLVSLLAALAVLAEAIVTKTLSGGVFLVIGCVPFVALLWFALDNAVFLLLPVRYTPGQGGAMQHTGRQMVMVFLRSILLALVCGAGVGLAALAWYIAGQWDVSDNVRAGLAVGTGSMFFLAVVGALIGFGGWALHRFDLSRPT